MANEYKYIVTRIEKETFRLTQVPCTSMTAAVDQFKDDVKEDYYSVAITAYPDNE